MITFKYLVCFACLSSFIPEYFRLSEFKFDSIPISSTFCKSIKAINFGVIFEGLNLGRFCEDIQDNYETTHWKTSALNCYDTTSVCLIEDIYNSIYEYENSVSKQPDLGLDNNEFNPADHQCFVYQQPCELIWGSNDNLREEDIFEINNYSHERQTFYLHILDQISEIKIKFQSALRDKLSDLPRFVRHLPVIVECFIERTKNFLKKFIRDFYIKNDLVENFQKILQYRVIKSHIKDSISKGSTSFHEIYLSDYQHAPQSTDKADNNSKPSYLRYIKKIDHEENTYNSKYSKIRTLQDIQHSYIPYGYSPSEEDKTENGGLIQNLLSSLRPQDGRGLLSSLLSPITSLFSDSSSNEIDNRVPNHMMQEIQANPPQGIAVNPIWFDPLFGLGGLNYLTGIGGVEKGNSNGFSFTPADSYLPSNHENPRNLWDSSTNNGYPYHKKYGMGYNYFQNPNFFWPQLYPPTYVPYWPKQGERFLEEIPLNPTPSAPISSPTSNPDFSVLSQLTDFMYRLLLETRIIEPFDPNNISSSDMSTLEKILNLTLSIMNQQTEENEPEKESPPPKLLNDSYMMNFQSRILATHNTYRMRGGLFPLIWDNILTTYISHHLAYLDNQLGCDLAHSNQTDRKKVGPFFNIGENLYAVWGTSEPPRAEHVSKTWFNEILCYRFGSIGANCTKCNTCEYCDEPEIKVGHFTQMMWEDITHIGCAVSQCENYDSEDTKYIVGCSYGSWGDVGGNVYGRIPFSPLSASFLGLNVTLCDADEIPQNL